MNTVLAKAKYFSSKYAYLIIFALLCLFFGLTSNKFFTFSNFIIVLRQSAMLAIAACGGAMIIMTGGLDLSLGSIISLSGMVTAYLLVKMQANIAICIIGGIIVGTLCGLFNGLLCILFDLKPFVVTLGTQTIFLGLSYIICGGMPIYGFPKSFAFLGQSYIGPIPVPVIIMIVIFILTSLFIHKTFLGRYIFAVGGNPEAARLAGIDVKGMRFMVFGICGFLSGVAGVVLCSRVNSGVATTGSGYQSDVITASLLGGVTLNGGEGTVFGVMVGCVTLGVLTNGMTLLNLGQYYQYLIKGAVLLVAVIYDVIQRRSKATSKMSKAN